MSFRKIPMKGFPRGRDAARMMQKMGMNLEAIDNVIEVSIKTDDKNIVIEGPEVSAIRMKGETIYQISGGSVKEIVEEEEEPVEDAKIVSEQTGSSVEEALKALKKTEGDLAQAILLLKKDE